ncbi:hypothetical protein ACTXT7_010681 [Hymenolepis weldensis]
MNSRKNKMEFSATKRHRQKKINSFIIKLHFNIFGWEKCRNDPKRESESLSLSCTSSQRSITLRDRVRDLKVSWDIYPNRFPAQSENETKEATNLFLAGFKDIPPELKIRIQITSRLHFGGNLSPARSELFMDVEKMHKYD